MDNHTIFKPEGFEGQRLLRVPPSVLKRMKQRPHTRDFLVSDLGYFPLTERHRVERLKGIRSYVLILVEAGQGWLELAGKRHAMSKGQVAIIPPHCPHAYGSDSHHPWKIYWFHFTGSGAEALLQWTPFSKDKPVMLCSTAETLRRHFRTVLTTAERGFSEHTLLELSRSLINILTLLHTRNPATHTTRHATRIEQMMDRMREQMHEPASLTSYAKRCGLSVSRFSEAFRQHCGVSPMAYLTELRIQRAGLLLETSELSVNEIARQTGFEDALYFSRVFRKQTGHSPSEFRRREA